MDSNGATGSFCLLHVRLPCRGIVRATSWPNAVTRLLCGRRRKTGGYREMLGDPRRLTITLAVGLNDPSGQGYPAASILMRRNRTRFTQVTYTHKAETRPNDRARGTRRQERTCPCLCCASKRAQTTCSLAHEQGTDRVDNNVLNGQGIGEAPCPGHKLCSSELNCAQVVTGSGAASSRSVH